MIPAFLCQQTHVPIHVPTIRACYIPMGIHQAAEASGMPVMYAGNKPSCLFGGLVNLCGFSTNGHLPCSAANQGAAPFG